MENQYFEVNAMLMHSYLLSTVYSGAQTLSIILQTRLRVAGSPCWMCPYSRLTSAPPRRGSAPSTMRAI